MAYIFGIIVLILLFVVLHFFTEIALKEKIGAVVVIGLLVISAYWYNQNSEERRLHLENVLLEFTRGQTITCNTTEVNNSEFSYSSGTQTFLGLKESAMYGRIISLDQCK
jgi:hypothetical protein